MQVGVLKIKLFIPHSQSLKDKRSVVQSVTTRIKNRYNVSITEVGGGKWQIAQLCIAYASGNHGKTRQVLHNIADFVSRERLDAEIVDHDVQIFTLGDGEDWS
jgi:hypothetical protein